METNAGPFYVATVEFYGTVHLRENEKISSANQRRTRRRFFRCFEIENGCVFSVTDKSASAWRDPPTPSSLATKTISVALTFFRRVSRPPRHSPARGPP